MISDSQWIFHRWGTCRKDQMFEAGVYFLEIEYHSRCQSYNNKNRIKQIHPFSKMSVNSILQFVLSILILGIFCNPFIRDAISFTNRVTFTQLRFYGMYTTMMINGGASSIKLFPTRNNGACETANPFMNSSNMGNQ